MKPAKDDRFLRAVTYQSKEETVMTFDPNNPIVQLCVQGMSLEGEGKRQEAAEIFQQAWNIASDDVEKCVAAHYVARHQNSIADKLQWDELALQLAMNVKDDGSIKGIYPSLHLNIAKGYEDLHDFREAQKHYELALHCNSFLLDDGYGRMIQQGVTAGLERIQKKTMAGQNPM